MNDITIQPVTRPIATMPRQGRQADINDASMQYYQQQQQQQSLRTTMKRTNNPVQQPTEFPGTYDELSLFEKVLAE